MVKLDIVDELCSAAGAGLHPADEDLMIRAAREIVFLRAELGKSLPVSDFFVTCPSVPKSIDPTGW